MDLKYYILKKHNPINMQEETTVTYGDNCTIIATNFRGNGSNITNLTTSNISEFDMENIKHGDVISWDSNSRRFSSAGISQGKVSGVDGKFLIEASEVDIFGDDSVIFYNFAADLNKNMNDYVLLSIPFADGNHTKMVSVNVSLISTNNDSKIFRRTMRFSIKGNTATFRANIENLSNGDAGLNACTLNYTLSNNVINITANNVGNNRWCGYAEVVSASMKS